MQFDNFDNKIKQAAGQHHPSYDENAWAKMQKLLDHHLPQNNDRRRGVIILLLFLVFLGGGALIIIDRPWQKSKLASANTTTIEQGKNTVSSSGTPASANGIPGEIKAGNPSNQQQGATGGQVTQNSIVTGNDKSIAVATDNNKTNPGKKTFTSQQPLQDNGNSDIEVVNGKVGSRKQPGDGVSPAKPGKDNQTIIPPVTSNGDANNVLPTGKAGDKADQPINNNNNSDKAIVNTDDAKKKDEQQQSVPGKKVTPKAQSKKANILFVSVSAGPDYSAVGMNDAGKIKPVVGAGVGYTINGRWTIRTGFYAGDKVYTADKYEYKPSVPTPPNPYLDKIDADCKVYEIPVSIAYTFNPSSKNQWFASTGLSSYIMKKENYVYWYKYPNGSMYSYDKTIDNENKHYFSVLTLSGGYQRKINKIFAIAAEPYIKLPLDGIGFGNVKLNSVGVLFSLSANLTGATKK